MAIKIFWKIFGTFFLGIVILTSLILFLSFKAIRSNFTAILENNLTSLNQAIKFEITGFLKANDYQGLNEYIKKIDKVSDARVTIVGIDGTVLADSQREPKLMDNHLNRPEIKEALKGGKGSSIRHSRTVQEDMLYVALPIQDKNKIIGISRVSFFLSDVNRLINQLFNKVYLITIIVSFIILIIVLIFSRTFTKPIKSLVEVSKNVAKGDFNVQVKIKNQDELGELATSFNFMINRIKLLFDELRLQKEELDSLIASVQEGFVVISSDGKIMLFNEGFKKLVRKKFDYGEDFVDVVQEKEILKLYKKIRNNKGSVVKEVVLQDKSLLCSATYVQAKDEIIFLLSDITGLKNLERIKRDIVANVSHELRTPLTAIKGYIETLDEEIDEKGRYYSEIIKRHTDRLINIVNDLLVLSELEESSTKLELTDVDFSRVCDTILKLFETRIKEKNIKIVCDIENNLPIVKLDLFKIEQVLINIIDNSIKFTNDGKITIEIKRRDNYIQLIISDTGIGIPPEHQERIFERFYTVDKSRSRKIGGTGLGLAIVKHIVKLHQGEIYIQSTPNIGTTFTIQLPININIDDTIS